MLSEKKKRTVIRMQSAETISSFNYICAGLFLCGQSDELSWILVFVSILVLFFYHMNNWLGRRERWKRKRTMERPIASSYRPMQTNNKLFDIRWTSTLVMHVAKNDSIINASTIIINRRSYVNTLFNGPTAYMHEWW